MIVTQNVYFIFFRDTAGQERFRTITRSHFRNTKGIVLAFDLTDKESFEKLEYWMESIMNVYSNKYFNIIFGTLNNL